MVKLSALIHDLITALLYTVLGYCVTTYGATAIAAAMSVSLPAWWSGLFGLVWIFVFFIIILWMLNRLDSGSKK